MSGSAAPERVDALVVGSGFGGSVAACRLAQAGADVLLLERGRRYPPGSFARRPWETARNVWDPSEGLQGLFDVWSFRRLDAVVAAGLGGGSLIYANVLLRKDERWFVRDHGPGAGWESWPVTRAQLDPCYDEVEQVLGATRYPYAAQTPKTQAIARAAAGLGMSFELPPLAVAFSRAGEPLGVPLAGGADNLHGVPRTTCRLCGECDIGCNDGSKNTLDLTYLTLAQRAGADVRDRCEVRGIEPRPGGGYRVTYVVHHADNEGAPVNTARLPRHVVDSRVLVLAAGALGTTYLLLRNRLALPGLGPALGTRFSGNGDVLAWIRGAEDALEPSYGPVITASLRRSDVLDGGSGRGFYVQDGGHPSFVDWVFETTPPPVGRYLAAAGLRLLRAATSPRPGVGRELARLLAGGRRSAGVLPLLAMGRDVPDGRLTLRAGYLAAHVDQHTSARLFAQMHDVLAFLAEQSGGSLLTNPGSRLRRRITVHPLGGAPMAEHPSRGVTDAHGEVFGHPGLFVADGSVMPGPVGANPALTIAALAERFSRRMKERAGVADG